MVTCWEWILQWLITTIWIINGQELSLPEYMVSECYGDTFNFDCGVGNMIRINQDFFGYSDGRRDRCEYGGSADCTVSNPKSNSLIHRYCTGQRWCTHYMVERRACDGFFTNYQQVEYQCIPETKVVSACEETEFEAQSTYIASPGFPHVYAPNLDCSCVVTTARNDPAVRVRMEIVFLAIHFSSPCDDWLRIGDKKTCGTTVDLYSGRVIPIQFHTDSSGGHSGFWLHFQASVPGEPLVVRCGKNVTSSQHTADLQRRQPATSAAQLPKRAPVPRHRVPPALCVPPAPAAAATFRPGQELLDRLMKQMQRERQGNVPSKADPSAAPERQGPPLQRPLHGNIPSKVDHTHTHTQLPAMYPTIHSPVRSGVTRGAESTARRHQLTSSHRFDSSRTTVAIQPDIFPAPRLKEQTAPTYDEDIIDSPSVVHSTLASPARDKQRVLKRPLLQKQPDIVQSPLPVDQQYPAEILHKEKAEILQKETSPEILHERYPDEMEAQGNPAEVGHYDEYPAKINEDTIDGASQSASTHSPTLLKNEGENKEKEQHFYNVDSDYIEKIPESDDLHIPDTYSSENYDDSELYVFQDSEGIDPDHILDTSYMDYYYYPGVIGGNYSRATAPANPDKNSAFTLGLIIVGSCAALIVGLVVFVILLVVCRRRHLVKRAQQVGGGRTSSSSPTSSELSSSPSSQDDNDSGKGLLAAMKHAKLPARNAAAPSPSSASSSSSPLPPSYAKGSGHQTYVDVDSLYAKPICKSDRQSSSSSSSSGSGSSDAYEDVVVRHSSPGAGGVVVSDSEGSLYCTPTPLPLDRLPTLKKSSTAPDAISRPRFYGRRRRKAGLRTSGDRGYSARGGSKPGVSAVNDSESDNSVRLSHRRQGGGGGRVPSSSLHHRGRMILSDSEPDLHSCSSDYEHSHGDLLRQRSIASLSGLAEVTFVPDLENQAYNDLDLTVTDRSDDVDTDWETRSAVSI